MTSRLIRRMSKTALCSIWNTQSALSHPVRTFCSTASQSFTTASDIDSGLENENVVREAHCKSNQDLISCEAWDILRMNAKEYASKKGTFFIDEIFNGFPKENKGTQNAMKNQLKSLYASKSEEAIDDPTKTCAFLMDTDFSEQELRCFYHLALEEEAKHEKLYLEYLVKKFKHWEWRKGWLDNDIRSSLFDYLEVKCPFAQRHVITRGLYLHKSKIPYDYMVKQLTPEFKKDLVAKINTTYKQISAAIHQIPAPLPLPMLNKVMSVYGFQAIGLYEVMGV